MKVQLRNVGLEPRLVCESAAGDVELPAGAVLDFDIPAGEQLALPEVGNDTYSSIEIEPRGAPLTLQVGEGVTPMPDGATFSVTGPATIIITREGEGARNVDRRDGSAGSGGTGDDGEGSSGQPQDADPLSSAREGGES